MWFILICVNLIVRSVKLGQFNEQVSFIYFFFKKTVEILHLIKKLNWAPKKMGLWKMIENWHWAAKNDWNV